MPIEINSGDTAWVLTAAALVMFMTPGLGFFYAGFTRSKNVAGHDHAELHRGRARGRAVGRHRLQPRLRPRPGGDHRQPGLLRPERRRPRPVRRLRDDGAPRGVHDLPGDVRHHYPRPHHRRLRGAGQVQHVPGVHAAVVVPRLRPGRALGLRHRAGCGVTGPGRHQRPGLRRRHGDPRQRRRRRPGRRHLLRPAPGLRQRADGAAQRDLHRAGRRHPLVRLVRLQRRQRRRGQRPSPPTPSSSPTPPPPPPPSPGCSPAGLLGGKPSVIGAAAGAVAGLVAITPASGFVQPMEAIAIGGVAGVICYLAVRLRARTGLDDSLDVVGVHGVGGTWGAFATGLFAAAAVGGFDGALPRRSGARCWTNWSPSAWSGPTPSSSRRLS